MVVPRRTITDQPMTETPLHIALRLTLEGLLEQLPAKDTEYDQGFEGDDTSYYHLTWMANRCLEMLLEWPVDKTSRWIGYIQGVLTHRGDMDPDKERDRTRPFFHEAYTEMGLKKPATVDRINGETVVREETPSETFDVPGAAIMDDWYQQTPDD